MAGQGEIDSPAVMNSHRLAITLEALGRTYDHVVIDAGLMADTILESLAAIAQRVVLVTAEKDDPAAIVAEQALHDAGFANVTVLAGRQETAGNQAAA